MNNKTSIIVTSHNYGTYLKKCLDSLFYQTTQALEIILINDSSSDNTDEIVKKYGKYKNFSYYNVDFQSAQKSRNFGLKKSKGEYLLNMDADNYLDKYFLEKTEKVLDDNSDIDLAYTDHIVFGDENLIAETAQGNHWQSKNFDYNALKQMNYIDTTSLIRKREFDGFDERVRRFQDWDAWLTFLKDKKAQRVAEPLLFKRLHKSSKTSLVQLYMERLRVMSKHNILNIHKCENKNSDIFDYVKGKTFCIIMGTQGNSVFLDNLVERGKYKKLFIYLVDRDDKECLRKMKKMLRRKKIVYRVLRDYNIDKSLKGFRMNNYMPAYSTDSIIIINNMDDEKCFCTNKKCDIIYKASCELLECEKFDDIDCVIFSKKGINKFLNV